MGFAKEALLEAEENSCDTCSDRAVHRRSCLRCNSGEVKACAVCEEAFGPRLCSYCQHILDKDD